MNLDTQSLMQISLFEKITKAKVKDCFEDGNKQLTFCVEPGELFKAIGKDAKMIKKIDNLFKRKIRIIEFDSDVAKFVKNLCHPNKVIRVVKINESLWDEKKEIVSITPADTKSRGYLIGKAGANLRNMELIVARYFKLNEIKIGPVEANQNIEVSPKKAEIQTPDLKVTQ